MYAPAAVLALFGIALPIFFLIAAPPSPEGTPEGNVLALAAFVMLVNLLGAGALYYVAKAYNELFLALSPDELIYHSITRHVRVPWDDVEQVVRIRGAHGVPRLVLQLRQPVEGATRFLAWQRAYHISYIPLAPFIAGERWEQSALGQELLVQAPQLRRA